VLLAALSWYLVENSGFVYLYLDVTCFYNGCHLQAVAFVDLLVCIFVNILFILMLCRPVMCFPIMWSFSRGCCVRADHIFTVDRHMCVLMVETCDDFLRLR